MVIQWQKRLWQIVALAIMVALIAVAFAPGPVIVDTRLVNTGPFAKTIEEEGKTRVTDRFIISSPVDGFARRIELNIGDTVDKSQTVASLEPLRSRVLDPRSQAEAKARIAIAKSALLVTGENTRAAKADAELAASELKRLTTLYRNKTISLGAFQQAQANARRTAAHLKSSEFAVEVAAFELEAAETALRYSAAGNGDIATEKVAIVTSVPGQVLKVYHKSEGVVKAGEPLMEIGDPGSLEVEVDVLSQDAVKLKPGTRVNFRRWGGDKVLQGRVRVVEPVGFTKVSALGVEEQRVLVIIDITSPITDWQRLGDGYRVEASFVLWENDRVLQIPTSALFRFEEQWAVFVLKKNKAKLRFVSLGHRSGLAAEVLSGLQEQEVIITHPDDSIHDGKRVRPRKS